MANSRSLLRKVSGLLPRPVRYALLRRGVRVDYHPTDKLVVRLARSQEELEQAYRILHDSYVDMGYSKADPSGMRITKYFALPTTSTFIALYDGEVVGTMSVIRETPLGLPMEAAFDLSSFRTQGLRIAEISSLAVAKNFRTNRGAVFLPMCKYLYDYVRQYMGLDAMVIAVNPSWTDFYEGLLGFEPIKANVVDKYDFANGAPAIGLVMNLAKSEVDFHRNYSHRPLKNNLHKYFVTNKLENCQFPSREFDVSADPVMTPSMLEYFFEQKSQVLNQLSEKERVILANMYPWRAYRSVLPEARVNGAPVRAARFLVNLSGLILSETGRMVQVREVSQAGLQIKGDFDLDAVISIRVRLGKGKFVNLKVTPVWRHPAAGLTGARIVDSDKMWTEYFSKIDLCSQPERMDERASS